MFSTCTSIVFQHSCLWISSGSSSNGNPCMDGITGSQEHLKAVWCRCLWDGWGVWQCWECWSLCSSSSLVLVPVLSLVDYWESCLPKSNDKERSGGLVCGWLIFWCFTVWLTPTWLCVWLQHWYFIQSDDSTILSLWRKVRGDSAEKQKKLQKPHLSTIPAFISAVRKNCLVTCMPSV